MVESMVLASFIATPQQTNSALQMERIKRVFKRVSFQLLISGYYYHSVYDDISKIILEIYTFPPVNSSVLSRKYHYSERKFCGIERELENEKN